jgi:hypothetical protein
MIHPVPKPEKKKKKKKVYSPEHCKNMIVYEGVPFTCELKLVGCCGSLCLSIAHRHKRRWYLNKGGLINELNQVVLACANCHGIIEKDPQLTKEIFERLRGEEWK